VIPIAPEGGGGGVFTSFGARDDLYCYTPCILLKQQLPPGVRKLVAVGRFIDRSLKTVHSL